jgi:biotin carboxyl carrier protein
LPNYKVQTGGRAYSVNVETVAKGHCQIAIESCAIECTCDRDEEVAAWSIKSDNAKVHARCRSMASDCVEVWVCGLPFQFSVLPVGPGGFTDIGKVTERLKSGVIHAVMPGRITSIMVKVGEVSAGTPLLVLEAMKMQRLYPQSRVK